MREEIVKHVYAELKTKKQRSKVEFCLILPKPDSQKELVCAVFLAGENKPYGFFELCPMRHNEYLSYYYDRLQHSRACFIDEEFWDKMIHADKISSANSYEEDMRTLYCCYDSQGKFYLCMEKQKYVTPSIRLVFGGLNDDSDDEAKQDIIKNGSYVFVKGDNTRHKCKVVKHLRESWYSLPKWDSHYDWIVAKSDDFCLETSMDSDADIDDSQVKAALQKFEIGSFGAYVQLCKAFDSIDAIVLFDVLFSADDLVNITTAKVGDSVIPQNDTRLISRKVIKDNKKYLAVYTSQSEIDESNSKAIYSFRQILELVRHTDGVNGLLINPNSDAVALEYGRF